MEWHDFKLTVHFHECDPARIAFYGQYLFWQEKAFDSMLTSRGWDHKVGKIGFPVVYYECSYQSPIPVWSEVKVSITVSSESSLKKIVTPFKVSLSKTEEICAKGETHRRLVSMSTFKGVECPQEWRGVFGFS